jgi:GNAT superfamily N-acetyltransferase
VRLRIPILDRGTRRQPVTDAHEVEVRPLQPSDAGAVARDLRHRVIVADRLARQARRECVYAVAWDRGRPVGQALLHWRRPAAMGVGEEVDRLPYLEDLFVLPYERRRGVGTALLTAVEGMARAHDEPGISLAVSLDNHEARRLYDRLGYVEAGTPPRRQPTSQHSVDGSVRNCEETVVDLVRWLRGGADQPAAASGDEGSQRTGKLTDRAMKQSS